MQIYTQKHLGRVARRLYIGEVSKTGKVVTYSWDILKSLNENDSSNVLSDWST